MRFAALVVFVTLIGLSAGADDGFELNLETLPVAGADGDDTATSQSVDRLSLDMERSIEETDPYNLVYRSAAVPRTDREYRLALWNSPMGRLNYDRAAAESMLGREGLVGGGRLAGLGMATTALGDGDPAGLELLIRSEAWTSLPLGTKVEAGLQASFVAALLYFMADSAN
jgi:hypothetical protein